MSGGGAYECGWAEREGMDAVHGMGWVLLPCWVAASSPSLCTLILYTPPNRTSLMLFYAQLLSTLGPLASSPPTSLFRPPPPPLY
jgi:hypothetical protein